MHIDLQAFSLSFVAASHGQRDAALRDEAVPGGPRVLLVCDQAGVDGAGADSLRCTRRLVDVARAVFDGGGLESRVLDMGRLCTGSQGTCEARLPAADGALIVLPAHAWQHSRTGVSTTLSMLIEHGLEPVQAGPCRTYGLVVHGDPWHALQVRRALCEWLDGMGLLDACEQARLEHFVGLNDPAPCTGMPPDGEAALEDETRAASHALVHAVAEIRAGRLNTRCPPLARVWPRCGSGRQ